MSRSTARCWDKVENPVGRSSGSLSFFFRRGRTNVT